MVTIEKYMKVTNNSDTDENPYIIVTGTAGWKLIEDGEHHAWACEHCGYVGGRGWDEPRSPFCSGCGFKMIRRNAK